MQVSSLQLRYTALVADDGEGTASGGRKKKSSGVVPHYQPFMKDLRTCHKGKSLLFSCLFSSLVSSLVSSLSPSRVSSLISHLLSSLLCPPAGFASDFRKVPINQMVFSYHKFVPLGSDSMRDLATGSGDGIKGEKRSYGGMKVAIVKRVRVVTMQSKVGRYIFEYISQ